jgi:DNA-binding response OmpR family regulator
MRASRVAPMAGLKTTRCIGNSMDSDITRPTPQAAPPQPQTPAGKRVLCVEDEHFIGELYARALSKAGYLVTVKYDGIEGLNEAKTNTYDIILLDIMVPNMKGTDILETLRKDMPDLRAKVIITTNLDQGEEGRAQFEKLADGYLIKSDLTPKEVVTFLENLKPN